MLPLSRTLVAVDSRSTRGPKPAAFSASAVAFSQSSGTSAVTLSFRVEHEVSIRRGRRAAVDECQGVRFVQSVEPGDEIDVVLGVREGAANSRRARTPIVGIWQRSNRGDPSTDQLSIKKSQLGIDAGRGAVAPC